MADRTRRARPVRPSPPENDLHCWLRAAIPPRADGTIDVRRTADRFGVSPTTVRRWLKLTGAARLDPAYLNRALQLAILRGRGTILWPAPDPSTHAREDSAYRYALRCAELIRSEPNNVPSSWGGLGHLDTHLVLLAWWPHARVWTVTTTREERTLRKILNHGGEITVEITAPNEYAAEVIKYRTLDHFADRRCVTPRYLVYLGHSESIRHGDPDVQLVTDEQ